MPRPGVYGAKCLHRSALVASFSVKASSKTSRHRSLLPQPPCCCITRICSTTPRCNLRATMRQGGSHFVLTTQPIFVPTSASVRSLPVPRPTTTSSCLRGASSPAPTRLESAWCVSSIGVASPAACHSSRGRGPEEAPPRRATTHLCSRVANGWSPHLRCSQTLCSHIAQLADKNADLARALGVDKQSGALVRSGRYRRALPTLDSYMPYVAKSTTCAVSVRHTGTAHACGGRFTASSRGFRVVGAWLSSALAFL